MSSSITMVLIINIVSMAVMIITTDSKGTEARGGGGGGRALFVFGDSLVDSGNNNYLPTTARADSPPYGIDYPTHRPTGRFSNGFLLPDLISQSIGSEPTLPYLSPELRGKKLLVGANFASAGAGILNDTGIQFVGILRMFQQFELFQEYQKRLSTEVGEEKAEQIVKGALVLMTLGGNDFVNNYFFTARSARSLQFTIPEFCFYLISEYKKILMRLYELGGRRVLVTGTGPLGCIPSMLAARSKNGECVAEVQEAAMIFNTLLIEMTTELNIKYGSLVFIAVNAFQMKMDFITDPQRFGFVTSKKACCGQGRFNGVAICNPFFSSLCPNRDEYVFWDAFHPTQRAWGFILQNIFNGTIHYMNPMNLSTIIAIDSKI